MTLSLCVTEVLEFGKGSDGQSINIELVEMEVMMMESWTL